MNGATVPRFSATSAGGMDTAFYKSYPAIYDHLKSIPKPDAKFIYGTAGFRMHYDMLPSVFIRVGIIGVLRSMYHKKVRFLH